MLTQRAHYEQWFEKRRGPRYPADEKEALEAADFYDSIRKSRNPSKEQIDLFVTAASSPRGLVWNCGVDLLRKLMKDWPEIADAVVEMSHSKKSHVRFNAICCVCKAMPKKASISILTAGITDKSGRVRWKAAQEAHSHRLSELVPLLNEAVAAEKSAKVRSSIDHSLRYLRDGYVREKYHDETWSLSISASYGISGRLVPDEQLRSKGLEKLLEEMRIDSERTATIMRREA